MTDLLSVLESGALLLFRVSRRAGEVRLSHKAASMSHHCPVFRRPQWRLIQPHSTTAQQWRRRRSNKLRPFVIFSLGGAWGWKVDCYAIEKLLTKQGSNQNIAKVTHILLRIARPRRIIKQSLVCHAQFFRFFIKVFFGKAVLRPSPVTPGVKCPLLPP